MKQVRTTLAGTLIAAIVMLSSPGCKKNDTAVGPGNSGGTGGSPISNAARQAAFDAVDQMYASVDWKKPHDAKATLVQFLRGRPEFEEADSNDDASVWARFTDGRLLIIANDRGRNGILPPPGGIPKVLSEPSVAGGELPSGRKASVLNAMGTYFTDTTPLITSMLKAKGYTVSNADPSVDNLAKINGDAVFYLNSHGGKGRLRDRTKVYSVWTTTKFDTVTDQLYNAMWANHELAYFKATVNTVPGFADSASRELRYAITKFFVISRMTFGQNSLVYIDACSALDPDFEAACIASSAGYTAAYAGWSYTSDDEAAATAAYFVFDRLLGTNMDPDYKEDPPQRPFRYPQILQELAKKDLNTFEWTDEHRTTTFDIQPATASFGFLAPSIERLVVDEQNERLSLFGLFGSDQSGASVTIHDKPQSITFWSLGEVHCDLPPPGPDESGDVKLTINGAESNPVRLTEWKGDVKVTTKFPGSIGYTVDYAFHIRADVHSFRVDPGGQVQQQGLVGVTGMQDSYVRLGASGTIQTTSSLGGGCTQDLQETWPLGSDSVTSGSTGGSSMAIAGELNAQNKTLSLYLAVGSNSLLVDNLTITTYCPNSPPQTGSFSNPAPFMEFDTLHLQFDDQWNLAAAPAIDRRPTVIPAVYGLAPSLSPGTATVDFSGATAINPPDPDAGQRPFFRRDRTRTTRYAATGRRSASVGN